MGIPYAVRYEIEFEELIIRDFYANSHASISIIRGFFPPHAGPNGCRDPTDAELVSIRSFWHNFASDYVSISGKFLCVAWMRMGGRRVLLVFVLFSH